MNTIRAAVQLQSLIMALVTRDGEVNSYTIMTHPDSVALGCSSVNIQNALQQLVKVKKLERFFYGKGKLKYGYTLPVDMKKVAPIPVVESTPLPTVDEVVENLKITVNQETSTLTVRYRNLNIDIKVVEK